MAGPDTAFDVVFRRRIRYRVSLWNVIWRQFGKIFDLTPFTKNAIKIVQFSFEWWNLTVRKPICILVCLNGNVTSVTKW